MPTLSVIIITKNESANIESCIETVSWADEIICMDSGSEDDTVNLARKHGAKVIENSAWEGYGKQRQMAQQHATSDWILMLDADERVTEALAHNIQSVVANDDRNKAFAMPRLSWCFGRFIRHGGWYPDYVRRLYPRTKGRYSDDLVHERLIVNDDVSFKKLSGDLIHYTYKNMNHYLVKSANYAAQWSAQRKGQKNKASLIKGFTHALVCFLRMYVFRAGFLDGRQGLLLALLSAHSTFVKYADLWVRYYGQKIS